ncbi:hypothetical protein AAE478_010309 [Parahypoxylon ruwenzoriense]
MLINIPPPPSNPETPSDMPGTPTSTTTSLSAVSTTAIKDGHRGHACHGLGPRGHHHHPSTNSLEAERADRISRLAGLERVSTLRAPNQQLHPGSPNAPQTTPTSAGFAPQQVTPLTPAYFDSNGQPTAVTKMSTVGTASATGSVGARTTAEAGEQFEMDADLTEVDEDGLSTDTNYRTMDVDSTSGAIDPMDEDIASRSVGGFEDRMSDDGTASLVGFGEGANSTVSGPIYHRRPLPGPGMWGLERSSSGLSQEAMMRSREMRDIAGNETPISASAAAERREAKYVDGVAVDGGGHVGTSDDDVFVDTTTRGPVPVPVPVQPGQPRMSALREGVGGPATREAAERIVRERLGGGEGRAPVLSGSKDGDKLGKFYFEEKK